MRTSFGWRLVLESVDSGSARRPEWARLRHWLAVCGVAGIMALALAVAPSRVAAGEAKSILTSPTGDDAPQVPVGGSGAATSRYVPRLFGLEGHRLHVRRAAATRPALGTVDCPLCDPLGVFDSSLFLHSTKIDNEWLPLKPGTQMLLRGVANRGGGLLPHLEIFTITDLLKRINGVPCVVGWDQDISNGVLRESELVFFAQSDAGDVWLSGEYPEEYDETGAFIGAENTWIHGVEGASAGVTVRKNPILGSPGYLEAIALENDFWDCGIVHSISDEKHEHHAFDHDHGKGKGRHRGEDRDTLVIREWAPLDGCDVIQIKTYVEGIGFTLVGALDDPEGETLALFEVRKLGRASMDSVRASALALDANGPLVNENYSHTQPAYLDPHHKGGDGDDDDDDLVSNPAYDEASVPPSRTFMSIGPNPATTSTGIAYGIARAGVVELSIFDVTGRKLRSIVSETKEPGTYRVQWDGRDGGGRNVAGGVYFARLRTGAELVQRTIVVAR